MKSIQSWVFGLAVIFLAGCSTISSVNTDYNPETNFSTLRTYNWMPSPANVGSNPYLQNSLFKDRVKSAVDTTLMGEGYQLNTTNPDFLVAYYAGLKDKTEFVDMGDEMGYDYGPWGWGPTWDPDIETYQYTESTLIIDFVDPNTKKLIWRGFATDALSDPEMSASEITAVVTKILAKFPPDQTSQS